MRQDLVGCLSPSKFVSYLEAGIPLLYVGPEQTNAWSICTEFDAGVHISGDLSDDDLPTAVGELLSVEKNKEHSAKVVNARDHFRRFNGDSLSEVICSSL